LNAFLYALSMDLDFFISHSSKDKPIADEVCATLERSGIRCWIAPRDIGPGDEYGAAIVHAIDRCRAMVLIFSANANASRQVSRELERAASRDIPILPVRIEDVVPKDSLAYFVGSVHWFDAVKPPLEDHLQRLAGSANRLLRGETSADDAPEDPSLKRLSTLAAMQSDRGRSPIWQAVGKFVAMSLIVCAGVLLVIFAASRWFEGDDTPPRIPVAERAIDPPAKTETPPATTQPVQGASEIVPTAKSETPAPAVDKPPVPEPVAADTGRPLGDVKADTPQPDAAKIVAVAKGLPSTEPVPLPSVAAPSPAFSIKDNPYFTAADAKRVEQVASEKKFALQKYQIAEIAPDVPAKFRRYVGIWATKIGFNGGLGAQGMLIVSDVDAQGSVRGAYMLGPPTPTSYEQRPAFFRPISGSIKNDAMSVVLGTATGTISFTSSNSLFVKWVRQTGPTAIATFYPVWRLSEHEVTPALAKTHKPD
jgi:hypothetical protein